MKTVDNCYDLIPKINSIHKNQFHFKKHKNKSGKGGNPVGKGRGQIRNESVTA